jgi:hypothetical protein
MKISLVEKCLGFWDNPVFRFSFFALLVWIAYYFHFPKFGLYEDDYWFIGIPANTPLKELWEIMINHFFDFQNNHGRYIAVFLPWILAFINFKIGGLWFTYIFGIILVALNVFLFHKIIKSRFPSELAFIAALAFLYFPADTTKALLVHIYQLQISLLFLMLAGVFWIRSKKWISYIFATLCLLMYESPFLPFILFPLLDEISFSRSFLKKFINHLLIVSSIILIVFFTRKLLGESRVDSLTLLETSKRIIFSVIGGPLIALFSFLRSPFQALSEIEYTLPYIIASFLILLPFIWLITSRFKENNSRFTHISLTAKHFKTALDIDPVILTALKGIGVGILMAMVGYLFSVTHYPPTALNGRATSVHLAATFGTALFTGSFFYFILIIVKKNFRIAFSVLLSFYFAVLSGYGALIQKDFIKGWELQKDLMMQIVEKCPDIDDGTIILLSPENLLNPKNVISYSWALPMILENLFYFPVHWERPPRITFYNEFYFNLDIDSNSQFYLKPRYAFLYDNDTIVNLRQNNVIFIENTDGKYQRIDTLFVLNKDTLFTKPFIGKDNITNLEPRRLYPYIINEP